LRIALKRGRTFGPRDREGTQRVTVIDESMARRFWPSYPNGEDPVGQHLLIGGVNPHPAEIIGIVANVHQTVDNSAWPESMYVAFSQNPFPFAMIAVRTQGEPLVMAAVLREKLRQLDRDQAVSDVQTMQQLVDAQLGERRVLTKLLASFAAIATLLAAVGTYGVIAYSVTQRTQELGIRRALGAREVDVIGLVMRQALGLAVVGTLAGAAGAFASTRLLKSFLFHVSATDPMTMAVVGALFLCITIGAGYLPVRRALDVDPRVALRYE
jgi:ABC-type antimicrobial peptide transport system permease subunit